MEDSQSLDVTAGRSGPLSTVRVVACKDKLWVKKFSPRNLDEFRGKEFPPGEEQAMIPEEAAKDLSKLRNLLDPIASKIASLNVRPAMHGQQAILRFTNDYGVEIVKHNHEDCFEMTVLKFRGPSYEFAFDTSIPDLNLGYSDEDVLKLCRDVAQLK
jgi:hypothetical protein